MEKSPQELKLENETLRERLRSAADEIVRLHDVIAQHTKTASGYVVNNYEVEPKSHIEDFRGIVTMIKVDPCVYEFNLAENLTPWSGDHRRAFVEQVIKGLGSRHAEKISNSIWSAEKI